MKYLHKNEKHQVLHSHQFSLVTSLLIFEIRYMGLDTRKPVFGVSDKARLKPACSATET